MNSKQKFENFLESLKKNGNKALIESVKKGFRACLEYNEEYQASEPLSDPHEYQDNGQSSGSSHEDAYGAGEEIGTDLGKEYSKMIIDGKSVDDVIDTLKNQSTEMDFYPETRGSDIYGKDFLGFSDGFGNGFMNGLHDLIAGINFDELDDPDEHPRFKLKIKLENIARELLNAEYKRRQTEKPAKPEFGY